MKVVQVNVDYTEEVNSCNKEWLNQSDRFCDILVRDDKAETVKYTGVLDQSQLEHVIIFIQDGRSSSDIKDLIEHYENENAKVDDLIGDPIFIEE